MKTLLALTLLILTQSIFALEIDRKLLATVISLSETKRTVLINKGSDQGLEMATHAKISLPFGMIARGVVVKVSPSRSVWSLYRVFHKDKLSENIAILLKISKPVKLTGDESKDLGPLADKIEEKVDQLNMSKGNFSKKQKKIARDLIKKEKGISAYSKTDFSILEEDNKDVRRDKSVDWTGIDGKRDSDHFDRTLDYSKLH